MTEFRLSVSKRLEELVIQVSEDMGIKPTDYIRMLILADIRNKGVNLEKEL